MKKSLWLLLTLVLLCAAAPAQADKSPLVQALGSEHVLVVHGMDGLDEISLSQKTLVAELRQGEVHEYTLTPSELGLHMADPAGLAAPSLAAAVDRVHEVLTAQPGAAFGVCRVGGDRHRQHLDAADPPGNRVALVYPAEPVLVPAGADPGAGHHVRADPRCGT